MTTSSLSSNVRHSGGSKGWPGWAMAPHRFLAGPLLGLPVFCLISCSSLFD